MKKSKIACVIPARNEELLIEETVRKTIDYWSAKKNYNFTLIVVNDGSTDGTKRILTRLDKEYEGKLTVINRQSSGDKGGAVRRGMLSAPKSDIVYFVDADMPFSLDDQFKVATAVSRECPVVYGSRVVSGKFENNSAMRVFASNALMFLNKTMLGITISDTQCGLKAFAGDITKPIFSNNTIKGFGFDLFTAAFIEKHNVRIKTVPVELLPEQRPSRVSVARVSLAMTRDLVSVRKSMKKMKSNEHLMQYSYTKS